MDAPVQTKHEIADVYRALMVMRADFDLLGHMMNECKDLDEIKRMVQLKVDDSAILMTQVSKVRSRFSGFEVLGMVAPVPDAFLPGPTDTELSENEAAMHRSLNAIALEVPASVAQHLRDAVLTCVNGYRKRLADVEAKPSALDLALLELRTAKLTTNELRALAVVGQHVKAKQG